MGQIQERIFGSWKTTLVGVAIILGALGLVYQGMAKLAEVVPFWVGAFGFFLSKDKKSE